MGLFSSIGKVVKNVGKAVSIKNAVNLVSGNAGAVLNEVKDRAVKAVMQSKASTAKPNTAKGINIGDILQSAAGGALAGAGVAIGGTQAGNAAVNATGWTAVKQWLRNNSIAVTVSVGALATGLYFIFRKPKKKGGFFK